MVLIVPELLIVLLNDRFCVVLKIPELVNNPVKATPLTTALFKVPALVSVPVPETTALNVALPAALILNAVFTFDIALPLVVNVPALTVIVGKVVIACEAAKAVLG